MDDRHLLGRLAVVEQRVRAAVARRRETDPDPDDGFRGLYLADHHVDALLRGAAPLLEGDPGANLLAEVEAQAGDDSRLRRLTAAFGLTDLDLELLLVALAPDVDARFEKLYGYLHDDVTQKRATTGLALELAGATPTNAAARARFDAGMPLRAGALLTVEGSATALRRVLRVPDRVTAFLLGDDTPDPLLADVVVEAIATVDTAGATALGRVLRAEQSLIYVQAPAGAAPRELAVAALRSAGRAAVVIDLERVAESDIETIAQTADREARLRGGGLVAGPIEVLAAHGAEAVRAFGELGGTVLLHGTRTWDPAWSRQVALLVGADPLDAEGRAALWRAQLNGDCAPGVDAAATTRQFRFAPEGLQRAAVAAQQQALLDDQPVSADHLLHGARAQNAVGLEQLARRISPDVGWNGVVLPEPVLAQLHELTARARNRDRVLGDWRMRPGAGRGRGITALFAGDSGTGKTLSAEVIAGELGLDLYTVDLATVVDKYIGETEKNLERIFTQADGVNGVLLFDEADALFGKRSEVKDARDRYANIEVAYLLQRMESFNGLAILSTNLRTNLDDAFSRRLDTIIDFPNPDIEHREQLWDLCLGHTMPRDDDIDLAWLAKSFELAGGHIRSICVTAAYLSAQADVPVAMAHLVRATQQEYRKLGRLILESEFGVWIASPSRV